MLLALALAASHPLAYKPAPFPSELVEVERTPQVVRYDLRYPSPVKSPFKANDTVWGHLSMPVKPAGERAACVLVLPVMAAPNVWIETRFVRAFENEGLCVLWLEMPYQFHRRPHPSMPSGQVFLARTAPRLSANYRQSVLDARRALDWLSKHEGVDPGRIALFGVSLGAIVGAAVYSVDPTPRYAAFMLGGADFSTLVFNSSMTGGFARKAQITLEVLKRAWAGIDPWDLRHRNAGKKALLINASLDTVVPKANALKLKEAFPDSRQMWVPFGHYSATLHLFWVPRYVARDVKAHLLASNSPASPSRCPSPASSSRRLSRRSSAPPGSPGSGPAKPRPSARTP